MPEDPEVVWTMPLSTLEALSRDLYEAKFHTPLSLETERFRWEIEKFLQTHTPRRTV